MKIKLYIAFKKYEYFEITNIGSMYLMIPTWVYLDEQDIKPRFMLTNWTSKGFHLSMVIQDFPLREKVVFLHIYVAG